MFVFFQFHVRHHHQHVHSLTGKLPGIFLLNCHLDSLGHCLDILLGDRRTMSGATDSDICVEMQSIWHFTLVITWKLESNWCCTWMKAWHLSSTSKKTLSLWTRAFGHSRPRDVKDSGYKLLDPPVYLYLLQNAVVSSLVHAPPTPPHNVCSIYYYLIE